MLRAIVKRPAVAVGTKGYRKQSIGVFLFDKNGVEDDFPSRIDVMRGPDEQDYPPGEYTIHPASINVQTDKYGSAFITFGRLILQPTVKEAGRRAAAA